LKPVPEIIDPVFTKTNQNARFLLSENERFGLVFVKTGSINSGTGVAKRRRLSWLTNSAHVYESKCGRKGGRYGVSANEYSCTHGAQINFGDLTPYLKPMLKINVYFNFLSRDTTERQARGELTSAQLRTPKVTEYTAIKRSCLELSLSQQS
jgi:hypothetical protein